MNNGTTHGGSSVSSGVLAPLRTRDYRQLWIGQVVSVIGDKINQLAMAMMVYAVTGSMLQMGIMLGVTLLPAALFGLVAGVFVDRWDRRMAMITADLLRAAVVAAIPLLVRFGVGWVYALAFVTSTVALFFTPAKKAIIPDIVGSDLLMAANSLDSASEAIAELVGLALGGAIVATLGYAAAFSIDAATFAFSAACIALIRLRREPAITQRDGRTVFSEAADGLRYIWHSDVLRELSAVYVFAAVFGAASIAICYALALVRYKAGATGVAMLDVAVTLGILLGSLLVGRTGVGRAGRKFLVGIAAFGVAFMLISLANSIWVAMVLLLIGGIANMWFFIPATTLFQTRSEDALRGRVMAASTTINRVAMALGIVGAGALAQEMPIAWLTAGVGLAALLVGAIGFGLRTLRQA